MNLSWGKSNAVSTNMKKSLDKSAELFNDFGDMTLLYLLGSGLAESTSGSMSC